MEADGLLTREHRLIEGKIRKCYAIASRTGSGKTTRLNLVACLYAMIDCFTLECDDLLITSSTFWLQRFQPRRLQVQLSRLVSFSSLISSDSCHP